MSSGFAFYAFLCFFREHIMFRESLEIGDWISIQFVHFPLSFFVYRVYRYYMYVYLAAILERAVTT